MDDQEQDYHNFSTSSSHRLPTISGTQAIRDAVQKSRPITTNLASLDAVLATSQGPQSQSTSGGIPRGVVTEIYGPPGVGKTTFALQLAVNCVRSNNRDSKVTWIDTGSPLIKSRLENLLDGHHYADAGDPPSSPPLPQDVKDNMLEARFNYMQITSLHKLLALFMHASPLFPPPHTALIVLDDLSNLLLSSLPRLTTLSANTGSQQTQSAIRNDHFAKQASSRRFQTLANFASALQRFAATHNVTVVTVSKATLSFKPGQKAILRSALSSAQWDACLSIRISLFRDFWPDDVEPRQRAGENIKAPQIELTQPGCNFFRCAQIVRLAGKSVFTSEIGFVIEEDGLHEVKSSISPDGPTVLPMATQAAIAMEDLESEETGIEAQDDHGNDFAEDLGLNNATTYQEIAKDQDQSKRKAAEIADSDDEEHPTGSKPALSRPLDISFNSALSPGSQAIETEDEQTMTFQTAKKLRINVSSRPKISQMQHIDGQKLPSTDVKDIDDDEMLLNQEERIPAFSQAAAEMSDPLTPSDDGRGSP